MPPPSSSSPMPPSAAISAISRNGWAPQLFIRTGRGVDPHRSRPALRRAPHPPLRRDGRSHAGGGGRGRRAPASKVSVEPAIASRWLVPRLGRFNELHPDIELAIDPTSKLADFRSGEADLGIRYGAGSWDDVGGPEAHRRGDLSRSARPTHLPDDKSLKPGGSPDYNLLHEQRKQWWADWLAAAGVNGVEDWRGTVFQNHLAIEAAEAGQGFALGDQILCTDSLARGLAGAPLRPRHEGPWHLLDRARQGLEGNPAGPRLPRMADGRDGGHQQEICTRSRPAQPATVAARLRLA